jgi:Tfp pilus assembly protein PilE
MDGLAGQLTLTAVSVVLATMGTLALIVLRSMQRQIEERRQDQAAALVSHQQCKERCAAEVRALYEVMPTRYVLKDDYLRTMASVDHKLDNLDRKMDSVVKVLGAKTAKEED